MDIERKKKTIFDFLKEEVGRPLLFSELAYIFDVPRRDKSHFKKTLDEMVGIGLLSMNRNGRYSAVIERHVTDDGSAAGSVDDKGKMEKGVKASVSGLITGRFQGNDKGFGFVVPETPSNAVSGDIFIVEANCGTAMHNDRVTVKVMNDSKKNRPGGNREGKVTAILERANDRIIGTYRDATDSDGGLVIPDNGRLCRAVEVPRGMNGNALNGQKVVVNMDYSHPSQLRGSVVEVLGFSNEPGVDILSVIRSYDFEEQFPDDVLSQAQSISAVIDENDLKGRSDLRDLTMVTIDDAEAKDLDDAVSLEMSDNGTYRLGVHIADVSHYVRQDTPLDKDAFKRGTSVYLADRVIPMLPQRLSNGICSLNPHVDRLAFSVVMDISADGTVVRHRISESVIRISERMTYKDVWGIVENNDTELRQKYSGLVPLFERMKELASVLRSKRMSRGAIDFDFDEAKIVLDSEGNPIDIQRYRVTVANRMIEEFMLACNETVAEHFSKAGTPFVYRIHEKPEPEKIRVFAEFVKNLGYHLKEPGKAHPRSFQKLIEEIRGKPEEMIISTIMLRSLQKARYSNIDSGHFGLAADYYCHFTSPIRRYPDLIIHRIMKSVLSGKLNPLAAEALNKRLGDAARHCSEREAAADNAERDVEAIKKAIYMKQFEGEVFDGVISNITGSGIFVELENTVEGFIRISDLGTDYFIYAEESYSLVGRRSRKVYRIGDRIRVQVAGVDIGSRHIDFMPEGSAAEKPKARPKSDKNRKNGMNGNKTGVKGKGFGTIRNEGKGSGMTSKLHKRNP